MNNLYTEFPVHSIRVGLAAKEKMRLDGGVNVEAGKGVIYEFFHQAFYGGSYD